MYNIFYNYATKFLVIDKKIIETQQLHIVYFYCVIDTSLLFQIIYWIQVEHLLPT